MGRSAPPPPPPPPPTAQVERDLTGDEAYQRRLQMSMGVRPPPVPAPADLDMPGLDASTSRPETGDEAYLRRVAMSTRAPEPAPAVAVPPRQPSPPQLAYNPFAPPPAPPPPPGPPGSFALDERARMAAAIAAKLGAIRPPQPGESTPPPAEEEKR